MKCIWALSIIILLSFHVNATDAGVQGEPQVIILVPSTGEDITSLDQVLTELKTCNISYIISSPNRSSPDGSDEIITPLDDIFSDAHQDTPLLIINGDDMGSLIGSSLIEDQIRIKSERGTLIGAIGNGSLVLAKAGILSGIRIADVPDADVSSQLSHAGALVEPSPGVISNSIITVSGSDQATGCIDSIIKELVAQKVSDTLGVIYLGDSDTGASTYIFPERLRKPVISAAPGKSVQPGWMGEPLPANLHEEIQIITGTGDWIITISPGDDVVYLTEPFTGLSIPYGVTHSIETTKLGSKRDLTTHTVPLEDIVQNVTFSEVYKNSSGYSESNKTLKDWTVEVNNTNLNVTESVALLFDDTTIEETG